MNFQNKVDNSGIFGQTVTLQNSNVAAGDIIIHQIAGQEEEDPLRCLNNECNVVFPEDIFSNTDSYRCYNCGTRCYSPNPVSKLSSYHKLPLEYKYDYENTINLIIKKLELREFEYAYNLCDNELLKKGSKTPESWIYLALCYFYWNRISKILKSDRTDKRDVLNYYAGKWEVCYKIYPDISFLKEIINFYSGYYKISWINVEKEPNFNLIDISPFSNGLHTKLLQLKKEILKREKNYRLPELKGGDFSADNTIIVKELLDDKVDIHNQEKEKERKALLQRIEEQRKKEAAVKAAMVANQKKIQRRNRIIMILFLTLGSAFLVIKALDFFEEKRMWHSTLKTNTPEAYDNYLNVYSNGRYESEVEPKREKALWNMIKENPTFQDYQIYLDQYPNSTYSKEANSNARSILWLKTLEEDSFTSYEKYLEYYPEYEKEVASIMEKALWKESRKLNNSDAFTRIRYSNSIEELKNFIEFNPDNKYIQLALKRYLNLKLKIPKKAPYYDLPISHVKNKLIEAEWSNVDNYIWTSKNVRRLFMKNGTYLHGNFLPTMKYGGYFNREQQYWQIRGDYLIMTSGIYKITELNKDTYTVVGLKNNEKFVTYRVPKDYRHFY